MTDTERIAALEKEVAELKTLLLQHCVNHPQPVPMPYYGAGGRHDA